MQTIEKKIRRNRDGKIGIFRQRGNDKGKPGSG